MRAKNYVLSVSGIHIIVSTDIAARSVGGSAIALIDEIEMFT